MPELKHNFLRGRMNKDFDERLVPNGEYRDALNVEVSTSEASEVGTVQNVKGNVSISGKQTARNSHADFMSTSVSNNAITVGSYVDESNKTIYNFIHKASDLVADGSYATGVRYTGVKSDVISEWKQIEISEKGKTYPLVVDVYEVRTTADIQSGQYGIITNPDKDNITVQGDFESLTSYFPKGIRKGMRVQLVAPDGFDVYLGQDIRVTAVSTAPNSTNDVVVITTVPSGNLFYTQDLKDAGYVFKFTSDRILNFKAGSTESEYNVTGTPSSNTPSNTTITGINLEDNVLFYTDGRTEPKRIPLELFKNKNNQYSSIADIARHSKIIYTIQNEVNTTVSSFMEEKHITVIRPNPLEPPFVIPSFTNREGGTQIFNTAFDYSNSVTSAVAKLDDSNDSSDGDNFSFVQDGSPDDQVMEIGDSIWIKSSRKRVNWRVGDVLELVGADSGAVVNCSIDEAVNTYADLGGNIDFDKFKISVINIPPTYYVNQELFSGVDADGNPISLGFFDIVSANDEAWVATLKEKDTIYPERFIYFACRYKYVNKEYSCISPYSKAVFQPGIYAYNSIAGFNNGMVNRLKSVDVIDFIPTNIPDDVEEVELLFKESNSDNAYIVKSIERNSQEWNASGVAYNGRVTIESEVFGSTLPSSQLVRIFDGVPKKAVSQEFSSSRLLFGNYTEGYDLKDNNLATIKPIIKQFFDIVVAEGDFQSTIESSNTINIDSTPAPHPLAYVQAEAGPWDTDWSWNPYSENPAPLISQQHGSVTTMNLAYSAFGGTVGFSFGGSINDKSTPIVNCGLNATLEGANGDPGSNYTNQMPYYEDNDYNKPRGPYYTAPEQGNYVFSANVEMGYNDVQYIVNNTGIVPGDAANKSMTSKLFKLGLCVVRCDENGKPILSASDFEQIGVEETGHNGTTTSSSLRPVYAPKVSSANILRRGPLKRVEALAANGQMFGENLDELVSTGYDDLQAAGSVSIGPTTLFLNGSVALSEGDRVCVCVPYPYTYVDPQPSFEPNSAQQNGNGIQSGGIDISSDYYNNTQPSDYNFGFQSRNASVNINSAPTSEIDIVAQQAYESIKSSRTYQTGIVYLDDYGRESTVLIDQSQLQGLGKDRCVVVNKVRLSIENNAPYWAKYYKVFIKEIAKEYYNIPLYKAYAVDQDDESVSQFVWLAFSSNERNKVKLQDYLVLKKEHGTNNGVTDENARWRVLDILDTPRTIEDTDPDETGDQPGFALGSLNIPATAEEVQGKFFVKIQADSEVVQYLEEPGLADEGLDSTVKVGNGACFEVETPQRIDVDLFYEISQAYPICLLGKDAEMYIKKGSTMFLNGPAGIDYLGYSLYWPDWENYKPKVLSVQGAESKDTYCKVSLSEPLPGSLSASEANPVKMYFYDNDGIFTSRGSFVSVYITSNHPYGTSLLEVYPYTHPLSSTPTTLRNNEIRLPWFNCFAFGNGVESDRIRDDFNAGVLYPYSSVGKQSGFKASLADADYAEVTKKSEIIFSQIYNDSSNVARYNEFILAEDITKRLNSEYGSIQKLYTRQGDVIAFCESKVVKILANKDALFNADGNQQLLSSTNVLGQASPFAGDYGISRNPESFAVEEYRIYFADRDRGAVCRLSMDGITAISDAGMKDWFNDNLKRGQALVGSYDGRKGEYNLTIHSILSSGNTKNAYTLSFSEESKGWTSFKSFIKESGLSMSNSYYTFKSGKMWLHHPNDIDEDRCNFYGTQNNSTLTALFNESPGSVKLFKTVNYEGTQSKEL